jgi:hypothetical protein
MGLPDTEVAMSNDKSGSREDEQREHEDEALVRGAPVERRTERHLHQVATVGEQWDAVSTSTGDRA